MTMTRMDDVSFFCPRSQIARPMRREVGIGLLVLLFLLKKMSWRDLDPGVANQAAKTGPNTRAGISSASSEGDQQFEDSNILRLRPRVFKPWQYGLDALCRRKGTSPPAIFKKGQNSFTSGFLYLKPSKTGSSTTSGINLRIARNVARRLQKNFTFCPATYRHHKAHEVFQGRNPQNSFLWTILRDPTKRVQSAFFHFEVSRNQVMPNDKNYLNFLQNPSISQHYRRSVALTATPPTESPNQMQQAMQAILDQYNFVGITERFDESLVVLQMLLDLPIDDILYLNAKTSGGYDDGVFHQKCTYIVPKFTSPKIKEYFDSPTWKNRTRFEDALYVAANQSLDLTIGALGRELFGKKMEAFRHAKMTAVEMCQADAVFPCLASGEKSPLSDRDCLFTDSGCGDSCLTKAAAVVAATKDRSAVVG